MERQPPEKRQEARVSLQLARRATLGVPCAMRAALGALCAASRKQQKNMTKKAERLINTGCTACFIFMTKGSFAVLLQCVRESMAAKLPPRLGRKNHAPDYLVEKGTRNHGLNKRTRSSIHLGQTPQRTFYHLHKLVKEDAL